MLEKDALLIAMDNGGGQKNGKTSYTLCDEAKRVELMAIRANFATTLYGAANAGDAITTLLSIAKE